MTKTKPKGKGRARQAISRVHQVSQQRPAIKPAVVLVASGKGGVGKTTVSTALAQGLAQKGYAVGLADCDLESPTAGVIAGINDAALGDGYLVPQESFGVRAVSIGTMIDLDSPVLMNEDQKGSLIRQFFQAVRWGDLDYLVVDLPPNGAAEIRALLSLQDERHESYFKPRLVGAVIVTEPTVPSLASVRRTVALLRMAEVPIVGIVENKAGEMFGNGAAKDLAALCGVPYLGSIPLDIELRRAGDRGAAVPLGHFRTILKAVMGGRP